MLPSCLYSFLFGSFSKKVQQARYTRMTNPSQQLDAEAVLCCPLLFLLDVSVFPMPIIMWALSLSLPVSCFTRQVDNAKVLHYVGAGVAFPTSMLFVCLQSALTYRIAKTQGEYNVAHLRLCLTLLAFVALVLSILSSHEQMAAFEAVKCLIEYCQLIKDRDIPLTLHLNKFLCSIHCQIVSCSSAWKYFQRLLEGISSKSSLLHIHSVQWKLLRGMVQ